MVNFPKAQVYDDNIKGTVHEYYVGTFCVPDAAILTVQPPDL